MANRVADRALQIFGGRGYMRENAAERFFRELRVDRIWEGASEIQRLIIARGLAQARARGHVEPLSARSRCSPRVSPWRGGARAASAAEEKVLNVFTWADYIAPDTIADFERETGIKVNYDIYDSHARSPRPSCWRAAPATTSWSMPSATRRG